MSKKTLLAALALVLVAGIAVSGEDDRRPVRRDGPPPRQGEFREFGPRHQGDGWRRGGPGGWHRGWNQDDRDHGRRFGPGRRGPGGEFGMRFFHVADLTPEQESRIVDIMTDNFRTNLELRLAMRDARQKVFSGPKDDRSADEIIAANRELGEIRGKIQAQRQTFRNQLNAVLTPEQLQSLDKPRRPDRPDRFDRSDRPGRPDRFDRPGRFGPGGRGCPWYDDDDNGVDDDDDIDE